MSSGWIGVDLDGTLAEYDGWRGIDHIGEPVPPMVERVRRWLEQGIDVRIFTARIATRNGSDFVRVCEVIDRWCTKHIGKKLLITNVKDMAMIAMYDDRCVQVEPNTGRILGNEDWAL